jgi:sugar (pentulose or hexulose) kinase
MLKRHILGAIDLQLTCLGQPLIKPEEEWAIMQSVHWTITVIGFYPDYSIDDEVDYLLNMREDNKCVQNAIARINDSGWVDDFFPDEFDKNPKQLWKYAYSEARYYQRQSIQG